MNKLLKNFVIINLLLFIFLPRFSYSEQDLYPEQNLEIKSLNSVFFEIEKLLIDETSSDMELKEFQKKLSDVKREIRVYEKENNQKILNLKEELSIIDNQNLDEKYLNYEIRNRKIEIENTLAELEPDLLNVKANFKRIEIINIEIDKVLKKRLFDRYFKLETSPLNIFKIPNSFDEIYNKLNEIPKEIFFYYNLNSSDDINEKLPLIFFLFIIMILIIFSLYKKFFTKILLLFFNSNNQNQLIFNFSISSLRFILSLFVVHIFISLIKLTDLLGYYGIGFLNSFYLSSFSIFGALWLRNNFRNLIKFSFKDELYDNMNTINDEKKIVFLGFFVGLYFLISSLLTVTSVSYSAQSIFMFPLTLINCFFFYKLLSSKILSKKLISKTDDIIKSLSFTEILINFGKIISLISPILGLIGYFYASQKILYNSIFSLFLISVSFVFFNIIKDIFGRLIISKKDNVKEFENKNSFFPVIFGFFIFLINVPIFTLIWGADLSDIFQIWEKLNDGVKIGSANITLPNILSFIVIFSLGFLLTQLIKKTLSQSILPKTNLDVGGQNAVITGVSYTGIIISAMIAISSTGLDLSSLAIVAGALSVGLGFGLQTIVSNFVSGIILLIERPIKDGDWIEVAGFSGTVRKISVRSTQIQTFDRGTVIVPNAELISGSVLNYTHSNIMGRVRVPVGVAYDTDVNKVEKVLLDIAKNHEEVLQEPEPSVIFMGFGSDSMNFEIRAFLKDVGYVLSIRSDMNFEIAKKFKEEGIEIPFPQRDIRIKNPEIFQK